MTNRDIFGKMVLAQYKARNKAVYEIVERDDGFIGVSSAQKYFSDQADWPREERAAMKLMRGRVLDVGCGAGRHALYLQRKGFDVTGLDVSKGAITVCKKLGLRKTLVRSIDDLRGIRAGSFDTLALLYNNFGLLQSRNKAKRILKEFHRITTPQGEIVAHSSNPYATADPVHRRYHRHNRRRGRLPAQLRLRLRFRSEIGPWFDYLLASPREMENIIKNTGWKISKLIQGENNRYIAVLVKNPVNAP